MTLNEIYQSCKGDCNCCKVTHCFTGFRVGTQEKEELEKLLEPQELNDFIFEIGLMLSPTRRNRNE